MRAANVLRYPSRILLVWALGLVPSLQIFAQGPIWTEKFPVNSPSARASHAMAYDANRGEVVLFGGAIGGGVVFDDTWIWDGDNWTPCDGTMPAVCPEPADRPPPMAGHAMAYDVARGEIVLYGGSETFDPSETWIWDGSTWTQRFPSNNPSAFELQGHSMAYDAARGEIVLFGGTISGGPISNETWTWDGTDWDQKLPTNSPTERRFHSMAYDIARSALVLFGGEGGSPFGSDRLGDTWVWDGASWTQAFPTNSPRPRSRHSMAYDAGRGQVVLFGGVDDTGLPQDTWFWDGNNWTRENPSTNPSGREGGAMAYDSARGGVVLFGGLNSIVTSYFSDTWVVRAPTGTTWTQKFPTHTPSEIGPTIYDSTQEQVLMFEPSGAWWAWDGDNWMQTVPTTSPPARNSQRIVYDSARGETVLFGGCLPNSTPLNDTWILEGGIWTQRFPATSPPARCGHAMAYDANRQEVLLYGGRNASGVLFDTWVWDGNTWTQKSPAATPTGGEGYLAAYDAARAEVLIHGGAVPSVILSETWTWNGSNWALKSSSGPVGVFLAATYDAPRQQILSFGGGVFSGATFVPVAETRSWNGATWTLLNPPTSPPASTIYAMAGDEARRQVVLFQPFQHVGAGTAGTPQTWVWGGTPPSPVPTISGISPTSGNQGQTITNFTINGSNFQVGATLSFTPDNITVNSANVTATQIIASISIANNAPTGPRDVVVTNPDTQRATLAGAFTVNQAPSGPPTINGVSPLWGFQGDTISTLTVSGLNFPEFARISFLLPPTSPGDSPIRDNTIVIDSYSSQTPTEIVATITIAPNAPPGSRIVEVFQAFSLEPPARRANAFEVRARLISNIAFIPGLLGSRLYTTVNSTERRLWLPSLTNLVEDMCALRPADQNSDGISDLGPIYTRDMMLQAPQVPIVNIDIYLAFSAFLDRLQSTGLITRWESLPYDWRLDPVELVSTGGLVDRPGIVRNPILTSIEALAADSPTGRVTLIGHSNGGLLAKHLLRILHAESRLDLVDRLILVGTPQIGTPQAIRPLLHGSGLDKLGLALRDSAVREAGETMSALYNLLPSQEYFTRVSNPVITLARDITISGSQLFDIYGPTIRDPNALRSFLLGEGGLRPEAFTGSCEDVPLGTSTPNTLARFSPFLDRAHTLHQQVDGFSVPDTVEVVQAVGFGLPTVTTIAYNSRWGRLRHTFDRTTDGDGTVVAPSAGAMPVPIFYLNLPLLNDINGENISHISLMELDSLQTLIEALLRGDSTTITGISSNPPNVPNAVTLTLHSDVSIEVHDSQGRRTGPLLDPSTAMTLVEAQIPNSSYDVSGDGHFITLDARRNHEVTLTGLGVGSFTLEIEELMGDMIITERVLVNVPVSSKSIAKLELRNLSDGSPLNLKLDIDGDGTVDRVVEARESADPAMSLRLLADLTATVDLPTGLKRALAGQVRLASAMLIRNNKRAAIRIVDALIIEFRILARISKYGTVLTNLKDVTIDIRNTIVPVA